MKQQNIIKAKKGQHLNQREFNLINGGNVEGLLLLDIDLKSSDVILSYNTDGLVNMKEFLRINEMSKRLFVVMMRNIAMVLKNIDNNKLSRDLISWNINTTYVNPESWNVYLMYIPLQPYEVGGNLKTYLQEIVSSCNFTPMEDVEYVQKLVEEMNLGVTYTVGKLEEYCDCISEQLVLGSATKDEVNICPGCSGKLMSGEKFCPFCGMKLIRQSQNDAEKQIDLDVSENDNGVLSAYKGTANASHSIWLEDKERIGKIMISKFPFRIGKMEGVTDYRIHNNLVSRKHADIIKENGMFYIVDLGSTNGTYLCGKRLQAGVKEHLADGNQIRFADAEYKVHID